MTEPINPKYASMPAGPGRPPGLTNARTKKGREAVARFVDDNAFKLQCWLDSVAEDNPAKAFELFMAVIEYHIPKLARTETVSDNKLEITIRKFDSPALPAAPAPPTIDHAPAPVIDVPAAPEPTPEAVERQAANETAMQAWRDEQARTMALIAEAESEG